MNSLAPPVLSVHDLTRTYDTAAGDLTVLRGVNLDVRPGEIVGLIGPSGSGKSSLLHAAGLLEHPTSGEVKIDGEAVGGLPERARTHIRLARIGFVYQFHHLLPEFDARDNVALPLRIAGHGLSAARERAEEQVDNDFARRVALITESLNSNAIDIAKSLSGDVSDTAWASYLRGDRGVFTRRAVRLLDNRQAREIAELYDEDSDFRNNVNRYIHDFEAMLRTLLSTRDGNALAVTLLGSEVGKLYVAMAQALERLRTS